MNDPLSFDGIQEHNDTRNNNTCANKKMVLALLISSCHCGSSHSYWGSKGSFTYHYSDFSTRNLKFNNWNTSKLQNIATLHDAHCIVTLGLVVKKWLNVMYKCNTQQTNFYIHIFYKYKLPTLQTTTNSHTPSKEWNRMSDKECNLF